jgi:hypothetical protein
MARFYQFLSRALHITFRGLAKSGSCPICPKHPGNKFKTKEFFLPYILDGIEIHHC